MGSWTCVWWSPEGHSAVHAPVETAPSRRCHRPGGRVGIRCSAVRAPAEELQHNNKQGSEQIICNGGVLCHSCCEKQHSVRYLHLSTGEFLAGNRPTRTLHALVVVRIDADFLLFGRERIIARLQWLQLVVTLKVGPAPHSAVNHMREALPMRHLEEYRLYWAIAVT